MAHSATPGTLQEALDGVSAVLITPFGEDGDRVDEDLLTRLVGRVDEGGVHIVTALGNTAEIYQLTDEERRAVLGAVVEARTNAHLLAGLAGPLATILRDAEHAASLGYDAVMLHEPIDTFASSDGLERFYMELADRLPLPAVLYIRSGRLEDAGLLRVLQHPNVVALKYARTDMEELKTLLASPEASAATWICGAAESQVPAFALQGILGFTSGLANLRPDLALDIWRASASGDLVKLRERVEDILPFELMRTRDNGRYNVAVLKRSLDWQGWPAGGVRPPCVDLDSESARDLQRLLESWPPDSVLAG